MLVATPARRDRLTDTGNWKDTGCKLHPSCLECPLERCVYDEQKQPGTVLWMETTNEKARRVALLRAQGLQIAEIAEVMQCSKRSVFRYLGLVRL